MNAPMAAVVRQRFRFVTRALVRDEAAKILWARIKGRKVHTCRLCNATIPGRAVAWRPIWEQNGVERYHRICAVCMADADPGD